MSAAVFRERDFGAPGLWEREVPCGWAFWNRQGGRPAYGGGSLRPAADGWEEWKSVPDPETVFRAPWLRKRLRGMEGALILRPGEGRRYLALPYDSKRPFPLPTLFCLASVRTLNGVRYAVFAFDEEERPVFQ